MPPGKSARLVRRQPLSQRLQAMLNPMDLYLWVSEEIQTFDWDSKNFGTRFGIAANFIFLLARANTGDSSSMDDVFNDGARSGWWAFLVRTDYPFPLGRVCSSKVEPESC